MALHAGLVGGKLLLDARKHRSLPPSLPVCRAMSLPLAPAAHAPNSRFIGGIRRSASIDVITQLFRYTVRVSDWIAQTRYSRVPLAFMGVVA